MIVFEDIRRLINKSNKKDLLRLCNEVNLYSFEKNKVGKIRLILLRFIDYSVCSYDKIEEYNNLVFKILNKDLK